MVESPQEFLSPVVPDRANQPVSETTERFLRAIVERVPLDRIEEVHLFSPLRQGTTETGIAVVASRVNEPELEPVADEGEPLELTLAGGEAPLEEEAPAEDSAPLEVDAPSDDGASDQVDAGDTIATSHAKPIERHTVYTARYRLVIKGPERGHWEADVVEEADAPLLTVETVVRGVQRRAGEDSEIVRYSAAQVARALRIAPAG